MAERKATRLSKAARELNVGITTIIEFLGKKGFEIDSNPNSKVEPDLYDLLLEEYSSDLSVKKESEKLTLKNLRERQESFTEEEDESAAGQDDSEELLINDKTGSAESIVKEVAEEAPVVQQEETPEPVKETEVKAKTEEAEQIPEKKPKVSSAKKKTAAKAEETEEVQDVEGSGPKVVGKIDLDSMNQKTRPAKKTKGKKAETEKEEAVAEPVAEVESAENKSKKVKAKGKSADAEATPEVNEVAEVVAAEAVVEEVIEKVIEKTAEQKAEENNHIPTRVEKLSGPTVVGKIVLPEKKPPKKKPVASSKDNELHLDKKKKRKRIAKEAGPVDIGKQDAARKDKGGKKGRKRPTRPEVNEVDVQKQIKDTLAKLTSKGSKSKTSKYRREKRDAVQAKLQEESDHLELQKNVLQVTEFVSVAELASMMNLPATQIIQTCMNLGLFVSINQRLDAETMSLVAMSLIIKLSL